MFLSDASVNRKLDHCIKGGSICSSKIKTRYRTSGARGRVGRTIRKAQEYRESQDVTGMVGSTADVELKNMLFVPPRCYCVPDIIQHASLKDV